MKRFHRTQPIRITLAFLLGITAVQGQTIQQDLVLSSYNGTDTEIKATRSITLKPGFYIPTGKSVKLFIQWDAAQIPMPGLPNGTQNYVMKTTYLQPFTNITGATMASQKMQDVSYYDGLGRPVQEVAAKGSPSFGDIVAHHSYDAFGRGDRNYLPYMSGNDGNYKSNAVTAQAAFYNAPPAGVVTIPAAGGTTPSFARPVYESSPLNRVLEQGFPGAAWQPGTRGTNTGRTVVTEYTTNNTTAITDLANTRLAKLYTVTYDAAGRPKLNLSGNYAANQLYVTVTKDENWGGGSGTFASRLNTTEEYTDKQGRVVLKRTFNTYKSGTTDVNEILSTYYVYDDVGNLCFVLTPGVNADSARPTETQLKDLCYMYQYDDRNRMKKRHLPGRRAWESFNYNAMDQLVYHENARDSLEEYSGFSNTDASLRFHRFYKYDGQGRMIMTGWEKGRVGTQEQIEQWTSAHPVHWEERSSATGNLHGYTNNAMPQDAQYFDVLEVNYYDNYDGIGLPSNLNKTGHSQMTQGLLVAKKTKVIGSNNVYLWTVYYYDDRGDNVRTLNQHYKGGAYNLNNYDDIINEYTFTHKLKKSTRNHYAGGTTVAVTVTTEYFYDHRERLADVWKTVTGGARTLVARNEYNEVGQLKVKNLHSLDAGSTFSQHVGYSYNERGWLRYANSELMDLQLQYNTATNKYYNGNIAYQTFSRKHTDGTTASGTYSYTYDAINRLREGIMAGGKGREGIAYDKLGNITALNRRASDGLTVDSLAYSYSAGKLASVNDRSTNASGVYMLPGTASYTYDANGNMLTRINSASTANNITATTYNYLDLPQSVTVAGTAISYVYDGNGRKLRSINGINGQTRDYIDGIEYSGTALELIQMEEGRILKGTGGYSYEYVLKDHLGNSRSGFKGTNAVATAANFGSDYYPFGLQYQLKIGQPSPKNNYLYNGKELQDKLKALDYGARFYDPVIGRWGSVDPLAENHFNLTSYNYVMNNPVSYIDLFGLDTLSANNVTPDQWKNFDVNNDVMQLSEVVIGGDNNTSSPGFGALGIALTAFDVGNTVKEETFDYAVRNNFKSNNTRRGWEELTRNQQIWRQKRTLGKVGYKYLRGVKVVNKLTGVAGVAVGLYDSGADFKDGRYYAAGSRLAVMGVAAGAAFIPVVGWGVSLGIGVADAVWGDEFYDYIETEFGK